MVSPTPAPVTDLNKKKILNDPVYGFITLPGPLLFDLMEHPFFQRLRRIKQLGMAEFVYPGALHTRFHHALGAMHLMGQAVQTLRSKGHAISDDECEAAQVAILLHDIGHGPFSHVLETCLLDRVPHEAISLQLMHELNRQFDGRLTLAIRMFAGEYERPFFHQLVSSQLDMDRMDYLNRDSFYTGVAEGTIGADRLIKMLDLVQDRLVVEAKGILSIENFLSARRIMYWQVYLHKTAICAEAMLIQALHRTRMLLRAGVPVPASPAFTLFLTDDVTLSDFTHDSRYLTAFTQLDDYDVWTCVKAWSHHPDRVLAKLCSSLLNRQLFKIIFSPELPDPALLDGLVAQLTRQGVLPDELPYFLVQGQATNAAYLPTADAILIRLKSGEVVDIADASDLANVRTLSHIVRRHYVCWAGPSFRWNSQHGGS